MRLIRIKDNEQEIKIPINSINENGRMIIIDQQEVLPGQTIDFDVFSVILSKDVWTPQFFSQLMNNQPKLIVFSEKLPEYIKILHEKGFNLRNLAIIGLRTWTKDEWVFIQNNKIRHFTMKEISVDGLSEICDSAMAFARNCENFFLSINLNVLDPSFTNIDSETGGLTTRELIYTIQRFKLMNNFKAADIITLANNKPILKIIEKLLVELG